MPSTSVPGFILDQFGNPYTPNIPGSGGARDTLYRRAAEDDRLRPRQPNHFADYIELLSPRRYPELVSECRAIASRGQPAALLQQKADYVSASKFRPVFMGQDAAYGAAALPEIESALEICNLRGPLYDWSTTWRLTVPALASDGSLYVLLTRWGQTNQPAVQILEAHRIGQRDAWANFVGKLDAVTTITDENGENPRDVRGAYSGCRISGGHIYNREGTEVAYRVLGSTPEQDRDISARDLYRVASPRSFSEGRTPPELAAAVLDFLALDLAQTCALDQQIGDAKLNLIETNATGKYDPGASFSGAATAAGTPTTIEERATTRFIKTSNTITAPDISRPSDQWMNFDKRVHSRGAASVRWRSEMLDPTELRGAATRAFQDQINTLIQESFDVASRAARRVLQYFAAVLAKDGVIPLHAETMAWGIARPPWFEVDRASARLDIEDVAAGRVAMSMLHQRDGHSTAEIYQQRVAAYKLAEEYSAKHGVPISVVLGDQGVTAMRTGGGSASPAASADQTSTDQAA